MANKGKRDGYESYLGSTDNMQSSTMKPG